MEQLNKIDYSGFYIAFTYCFIGGAYFMLAIISKGLLSAFYLIHTGYKGHQHISVAEYLMFAAVAAYSVFYIYSGVLREPTYTQTLGDWGEIIEDELILRFNANMRNFDDDDDLFVSVRFWPFLVVTAMWIYLFSRLQMHRGIGSYVIMVRLAANELAKFLIIWLVSLFFFAGITLVWLGEFEEYQYTGTALRSLYLVSIGMRDMPEELKDN